MYQGLLLLRYVRTNAWKPRSILFVFLNLDCNMSKLLSTYSYRIIFHSLAGVLIQHILPYTHALALPFLPYIISTILTCCALSPRLRPTSSPVCPTAPPARPMASRMSTRPTTAATSRYATACWGLIWRSPPSAWSRSGSLRS